MWRGTLLDSKKGKLTDSFPSRDSYPWEVHLDSFFDSLLGSKLRLISYFFILNGLTFQAYFSLGEILFSLIFQPFSAIPYFWLRSRKNKKTTFAKLVLLYAILISIRLFFLFSYDSLFIKERQPECRFLRQRECPRIIEITQIRQVVCKI